MAVEVSQLKAERNFDGASVRMFPLSTGQFLDVGKAFESRISTVDQIMESLTDPTVHAIGLYGFGGVGKTTSARQAAKKAQEGTLFDIVILAGIKIRLKKFKVKLLIYWNSNWIFEVECAAQWSCLLYRFYSMPMLLLYFIF